LPGVAVLAFDGIHRIIVLSVLLPCPILTVRLMSNGYGQIRNLISSPANGVRIGKWTTRTKGCHSGSRWLSFPKELHGAGLRAVFSVFLDESDEGADFQPLEVVVQDAVSMKVNLPTVRGL
jgi:hypothetical protein